jgi:hypothetical protein
VSFLSLEVNGLGGDRVRVSGAVGKPRPDSYKVSATYRDGFRAAGTLTIIGRDAATKAQRCGELVLQRVREAGFELREAVVECVGGSNANSSTEVVLRVAVAADSREAVERFSRELIPFVTAGPQGTTGYAEGRPRVHPVFRYWPCLIAREAVEPRVEIVTNGDARKSQPLVAKQVTSPNAASARDATMRIASMTPGTPAALLDIACARSGDKGIGANVGVIVRNQEAWTFLRTWLTAERVSEFLSPLGVESIERFELPNLGALNFVLSGVLRQGLRTDAQGKAIGQMLLEMQLPADAVRSIVAAGRE